VFFGSHGPWRTYSIRHHGSYLKQQAHGKSLSHHHLLRSLLPTNQPCPNGSLPICPGRPFSFLPNKRPIEDLIPFFFGALWSESWLLLLLLGLLAGPSWEPVELQGRKRLFTMCLCHNIHSPQTRAPQPLKCPQALLTLSPHPHPNTYSGSTGA
jgi:hypothetical protein